MKLLLHGVVSLEATAIGRFARALDEAIGRAEELLDLEDVFKEFNHAGNALYQIAHLQDQRSKVEPLTHLFGCAVQCCSNMRDLANFIQRMKEIRAELANVRTIQTSLEINYPCPPPAKPAGDDIPF